MAISTLATEYQVTAYPDPNGANADQFTIYVRRLAETGLWVVRWRGFILSTRHGTWDMLDCDSNDETARSTWLHQHRFATATDAIVAAQKAAPDLKIMGYDIAHFWAEEQARTPQPTAPPADQCDVAVGDIVEVPRGVDPIVTTRHWIRVEHVGILYIGGTKVKADGSLSKNRHGEQTRGGVRKELLPQCIIHKAAAAAATSTEAVNPA